MKIGFLDDESEAFADYNKRLSKYGIELLFVEDCVDKEDVLNWIINNEIQLLLVDYMLSELYDFNGTELIYYLNDKIPDFTCLILTSHTNDSSKENLVTNNLIIDKNELDARNLTNVVERFKQSAEVFINRIKLKEEEYRELKHKKETSNLNVDEEEKFLFLYRILKAYGVVDDLPEQFLKPESEKKIDALLQKLDEFLKK